MHCGDADAEFMCQWIQRMKFWFRYILPNLATDILGLLLCKLSKTIYLT